MLEVVSHLICNVKEYTTQTLARALLLAILVARICCVTLIKQEDVRDTKRLMEMEQSALLGCVLMIHVFLLLDLNTRGVLFATCLAEEL